MKFIISFVIAFRWFSGGVLAQEATPVFTSGTEGFKSFRIPAIVRTPQGELLAFAEGRVQGSGDFGDIDIVLKRSKDGGKSWSAVETVVNYNKLQAGNPAPVLDLQDPRYPKGRLFLFYNTGNNHENEVRKGKGLREVWYKSSLDGGISWSVPVNITTQVHRPKQPQVNPDYNFQEDWRSYANTPGHAMQFTGGKYNGRIYVAANHSAGESHPESEDYQAHAFYSDDHGATFKLSEKIGIPGSNEASAAQLSDNRLMLNARNQKGDVKARIVAISTDGGAKWDTAYFDANLPDPICEGSILTVGKNKGKHILAFSNAADIKNRNNLTLRISYDEGKTWARSILIGSEPGSADYTAYSDIVQTGKRTIGVLYEFDDYRQIVYKEVEW